MLREIPRRSLEVVEPGDPQEAVPDDEHVHHSPTTSRVWATEQFMSSKLFLTHGASVLGCMVQCTTADRRAGVTPRRCRVPGRAPGRTTRGRSSPRAPASPPAASLRVAGHPEGLGVDPRGSVEPGPPPVAQGHRLPVPALRPRLRSSPAGPADGSASRPPPRTVATCRRARAGPGPPGRTAPRRRPRRPTQGSSGRTPPPGAA